MSPASRDALVKRYLTLQDEMWKLAPGVKVAHITADMSDDEIIRLGKKLAGLVEAERCIVDDGDDEPNPYRDGAEHT